MAKRILALVCAITMLCGLAVMPAAAVEPTENDQILKFDNVTGLWKTISLASPDVPADLSKNYSLEFKFKVDDIVGTGNGKDRPFAIQTGTHLLAVVAIAGEPVKLYMTDGLDWGGSTISPNKPYVRSEELGGLSTVGDWITVKFDVYQGASSALADIWVNGEKKLTGADYGEYNAAGNIKNATPLPGYGGSYFKIATEYAGWDTTRDLTFDYINLTFDGAPATIAEDEFTYAVADGSTAVPTYRLGNKTWTNGAGALATVMDDPSDVPAENEQIMVFSDQVASWVQHKLSSTDVSASLNTAYSLEFKMKVDATTDTGRPFGIMTGGHMLAVSPKTTGTTFCMTDSLDWGGSGPATATGVNGCLGSGALATVADNTWAVVKLDVKQGGDTALVDVTINGTKVLENANYGIGKSTANVKQTAPMPGLGGYYFVLDGGASIMNGALSITFDYINLTYEGAPAEVANDEFNYALGNGTTNCATYKTGNKTWTASSATNGFKVTVKDDPEDLPNYEVALSSDGNGYVQATAAQPHVEAAIEYVNPTANVMTVYTFPKAGYELNNVSVDGVATAVVPKADGSFDLTIAENCAVVVNFKAATAATPSVVKTAASVGDKALNLSPTASQQVGGDWFGMKHTDVTNNVEGQEYTTEFRFNLSNYVTKEGDPGRTIAYLGIGGNNYIAMNSTEEGMLNLWLTKDSSQSNPGWIGEASKASLGSLTMDEYHTIAVHNYLDGGAVKTDVTIDGRAVLRGVSMTRNAALIPTFNNDYGRYIFVHSMSNAIGVPTNAYGYVDYDMAYDYISLTLPNAVYRNDFEATTATVGNLPAESVSNGYSYTIRMNDNARFDLTTVNGAADANKTSVASGIGAATLTAEGVKGGVEVVSKIAAGSANNFGIIVSEEALTGIITPADIAAWTVTEAEAEYRATSAFAAIASAADGRFGVNVFDGAATEYFKDKTLYVYVYAANDSTVDYAPVYSAAGFAY